MTKNARSELWNLPNALTMLRIAIVPVFVVVALAYPVDIGGRIAATLLFVAAMATDYFDGRIARARGLITDFGKVMDPLADKAITGAALIILSVWAYIPWWITVLILVREIGITIMRFTILRYGALPANFSGKAKTMVQSVALTYCLLPFEVVWPAASYLGVALMLVALVLTLWSGWLNVRDGMALRREALAKS
ncbi:CDP-diacylglycerol--glycerol-3-phosphate 3-phosphatidyltransferase [Dermabacteraceae bacterium TAE3-ERU27]|nr:CDP-diacylglycerol--glycerol-3-phosphate 3-phosphatidyltransferase [Dermabacteraceae bacterium TAE3-ERU27]